MIWLFLIIAAALLEGLTVGLFIPLLAGEEDESLPTQVVMEIFNFLDLDYSVGLILAFMSAFFILRSGFLVFQEAYSSRILTKLLIRSKKKLLDDLFHSEYQYFTRNESGRFINALTIEFNRVVFAFEMCLTLFVGTGFALVYFALPMSMDPIVSSTILAMFIPIYFILRKVNQKTREYSIKATAVNARFQSYLIQLFHNFKYIKATHSGTGIIKKADYSAEQQGDLIFRQTVLSAFVNRGTELILLLLVAGLLFYNTVILSADFVALLFILFLLRRASIFAMQAQGSYRKFLSASGSIGVFQQLEIELSNQQEDLEGNGIRPDFNHSIRFENLSFNYNSESFSLDNINLSIPPNKTVAIVGASGSGKSTLATILTGILKPTGGGIFLGDQNYENIDKRLLRRNIGYVTQESVIFNDTIRNNITLWDNDCEANNSKVQTAVSKANLGDFISSLPDGHNTTLGDNGINVSGGQRQRINIAREIYKDVKLLIFDEATSSLDSETEMMIQSHIDEFKGEKTIVVIAHRLSTVKNSDMIFVVKDGKISEQGTYDDLYALGGEFTTMVNRQDLS